MSEISTEDCKKYLVEFYENNGTTTAGKDWKRTKKSKNSQGNWVREFTHPTIGDVSLLEDATGNLAIIGFQKPGQNPASSASNKPSKTHSSTASSGKSFDLLVFSDSQIKQAWKTYKAYYQTYYIDDNDDIEDVEKFAIKHDKSIRCIPSILSWYVPPEDYENFELDSKKISWDFNMKGFNLVIFDHDDFHEYGAEGPLMRKYLPTYLSKCDETHFEVEKDITIEQLVRDLSAFGYTHSNSYGNDKSVFSKLLKTATFNKIPFTVSQLETDILNSNLQSYTTEELETQKVNNQSIAFFAFENDKLDVFNYLIDKKVSISNEDFFDLIDKNVFNFEKEPQKLNVLVRLALEYDRINLDESSLGTLVYNLNKTNQRENLISLFNKYVTEDNILNFSSSDILLKEQLVIDSFVKRFAQHDDKLTSWVAGFIVHGEELELLSNKEVRNALTKDYVSSILNDMNKEYIDNLKYQSDRSKNGFEVVEVNKDGTQQTWTEKSAKSFSKFVILKNRIMSYFNKNDDDNEPKKVYRTKF